MTLGMKDLEATIGKTKSKTLYRGVFSLSDAVIIRRAYAYTEKQAKTMMIRRIAKEKGLAGMGGLFKVFDGTKDNFVIEVEANQ